MAQADPHQHLLDTLKAAIALLELQPDSSLKQDGMAVCNQMGRASFRIAVFGPFNYGKSTLLNAMLGERALPIDLIPTTGAAIAVKYGAELRTQIRLCNGTVIDEPGTDVLKQFAILAGDRRMREDVASVDVFCPHPFLQTGVELMDLPGTDDQEAQDALVKHQLLTADLVVQLLDGRKLMTLGEREHLRDWLLDRGIETVVFVVNFLNLLEPDDQKQVYNRLRFVAESFRAQLPAGVSNLYRVDALPALRARLKGDAAAAQTAGLPMFESALQTITQVQREQPDTRLPRVKAIAHQVQQALQTKISAISTEVASVDEQRSQKTQIKQQAANLIRQGFTKSMTEFTDWLSVTNLLERYQSDAAQALQQGQFRTWATAAFKTVAIDHQQAVVKWVHQACDFFERSRPNQLLVGFPPEPQIQAAESPPPSNSPKKSDLPPEAIAGGAIGWMLGGPVGAVIAGGASYLLNKTLASDQSQTESPASTQPIYVYLDAAREYLVNFSAMNLAALKHYEVAAERVIQYQSTHEPTPTTHQHYQLQLLQTTLESLEQALQAIS